MTGTQALLSAGAVSLPVSISAVADFFGIKLVDYNAFTKIYDVGKPELYRGVSYGGFSLMAEGRYICVLNGSLCGKPRRRWTAAHEIGHILSGHISAEIPLPAGEQEREADCFAAELLAPLTVLHFCGASSALEIERMCGLSRQAAELRFQELSRLRRLQEELYVSAVRSGRLPDAEESVFLRRECDRQLLLRFSPFIGSYISRRSAHDGYRSYLEMKSRERMAI